MWSLSFITQEDFYRHVRSTIEHYGEKLTSYDLRKFNSNIVDPIKLIFDKMVYGLSFEEIISNELFRQRDKANNNDIGYFHQRIFQYMANCTVPQSGWDVIVSKSDGIDIPDCGRVKTVYVEMKNKHNTMNSASGSKTYMKMQGQLLKDDDCACFLVEAIAKKSQNVTWQVSVDGVRQKHKRIRRVSMDEFYYTVTGEKDAFYQMCMALPAAVEHVIAVSGGLAVPKDTVIDELHEIAQQKDGSFVLALYMLGFGDYMGFSENPK